MFAASRKDVLAVPNEEKGLSVEELKSLSVEELERLKAELIRRMENADQQGVEANLEGHVRAMSGKLDPKGYMTGAGITEQSRSIGLSEKESKDIALRVQAPGAVKAGLCPYYVTPQDANKYMHGYSLAIYDRKTGKVNREKLDAVDSVMTRVQYDQTQELVLYKSRFDQYLDECRKETAKYSGCLKSIEKDASDMEWSANWQIAASKDRNDNLFIPRALFRGAYLTPDLFVKVLQIMEIIKIKNKAEHTMNASPKQGLN
jgi:hypothetical protein